MPSRRLTLPAVTALALACIALGVLAALADGSGRPATVPARPVPPRVVAAVPAVPVPVAAARRAERLRPALRGTRPLLVAAAPGALRPYAIGCGIVRFARPVSPAAPKAEPVPDDLLHAFGILRRAATADDALPKEALTALREHGLEPFDPAAARLIRTTPDGGRAWVVPTRDVPELPACSVATPLAPPAVVYNPKAPVPVPALPATPATPATPRRGTTSPRYAPHPGLALVALGGAPVGAGGRYEDLIRGREDVALDPCGGPSHDMLSVSGLVPDGVPAAFLTSPDGTAIRADVRDNAYTFVVPRSKRAETRYVVWTGGDGTPHVQPLTPVLYPSASSCARIHPLMAKIPAVSPSATTPILPAPVAVKRLPALPRHK
jgi:hypothetical protein